MNNWEKSNLELTPAPDMTVLDESGNLTVLIKHDYYSSDNDHGRLLLGSFLDTLTESGDPVNKLILLDTAVRLLEDSILFAKLLKLIEHSKFTYICEDSLAYFDIEYSSHDNVIVCSASDLSLELLQTDRLIVLE